MPNASLLIVIGPLYAVAALLCGAASVAALLVVVTLFAVGLALVAGAREAAAPTRAPRRSTGVTN